MTPMAARRFLAYALLVTALVMLFAPTRFQVWFLTWVAVLLLIGYVSMTLLRWTRPRHGLYRRRHSRW